MVVARLAVALLLAIITSNTTSAQSSDVFDELLFDGGSQTGLTDWKGFVDFTTRRYIRGSAGRTDAQAVLWSEFEAEFRLSDSATAFLRPRLYADVGNESFERWQIPDAYFTYDANHWDLRAGLMVENWGVVDTFSPLDILNSRDLATEVLDPLKIGQAGLRVRGLFSSGERFGEPTLSLYWMPDFQLSRYAPPGQRLHPGSTTQAFGRNTETEPDGKDAVTWGLRFQSTLQTRFINADLQLIATQGPDRYPPLRELDNGRLSPAHQQVKTAGFGLRAVPNSSAFGYFLSTLTFKGEVARRWFQRFPASPADARDGYWTYVLGVNKEWPNLLRERDELSLTLEYLWDTESATFSSQRLVQHDAILRLQWSANDFNKTSLELLSIHDHEDSETVIEASLSSVLRVISEDLTLKLRYQYFDGRDASTFVNRLSDPSSLSVSLRWVFAK